MSASPDLPLRARLAWLAGRLTATILRALRRGATTLPGRIALRLDPSLPGRLVRALPRGAAVISGTNGKTTTSAMLAAVLERSGWRLAHNRGGANLRTGITTALLLAPPEARAALLEVDEATMPFAGRALAPRLALITNFFRDQLDRYGELETAVALVRRGIAGMPDGAVVVLNADDPLAASLGHGLQPRLRLVHFGAEAAVAPPGGGGGPSDAPRCPHCGGDLAYAPRYYAQLGIYRCDRCGLRRPRPDVAVSGWVPGDALRPGEVTLRTPAGEISFPLALPGLYNAYNAAAAVAAALALGAALDEAGAALGAFRNAFGRMEWLELAGHRACLALVKNPVGCSEVLRAVVGDASPGKALVVLLNDRYADGTDVSWIWDADFEAVAAAQEEFALVVAGGRRARDMALRLKYAGVTAERLRVCPDPAEAMALGARAAAAGAGVYILPTYTAMLEARAALVRQGRVQPFWEA